MLPKRLLQGVGAFLPVLMLFSSYLFAQERLVTGRITDAVQGTGLPGVSVSVKGTTIGTRTNENGEFRLNVPSSGSALIISSVGFGSREVSLQGISNINLTLSPTNTALNEVIVVGYGT